MKKFGMLVTMVVAGPLSAGLPLELYNIDFTAPEVGTYQTVFGSPSIEASVGPFTDALVFEAVTGYEQIRLPIDVASPRFDIQYDALVHNLLDSEYSFKLLLDTPAVRNVIFHGGQNVMFIYQPFSGARLDTYSNDQVYHFRIWIDFENDLWTVEIDDTLVYSNPIGATSLNSIRFSMSPWIGGCLRCTRHLRGT